MIRQLHQRSGVCHARHVHCGHQGNGLAGCCRTIVPVTQLYLETCFALGCSYHAGNIFDNVAGSQCLLCKGWRINFISGQFLIYSESWLGMSSRALANALSRSSRYRCAGCSRHSRSAGFEPVHDAVRKVIGQCLNQLELFGRRRVPSPWSIGSKSGQP